MTTLLSEDESIPKEIMRPFAESLQRLIHGRAITHSLLDQLDQALYDGVVRIRNRGFKKMPALVSVVLERHGWIEIVRADLERDGIKRVIQNLIRRFPNVNGVELALSIRRAFPTYNPDDAQTEHARVEGLIQAQLADRDAV